MSAHRVVQAVNLTTDPDPAGHRLDQGGHVVTAEEAATYALNGFDMPEGTRFLEKRAIRIRVKVPTNDRRLKRWQPWARKNCEPGYPDELAAAAGLNGRKVKSWWLYFGTVPPEAFLAIDVLIPEEERDRVTRGVQDGLRALP